MKPRLTGAIAFAFVLIVPATAQAAAITTTRSCFLESTDTVSSKAPITGSGFAPNSQLAPSIDGRRLTDSDGNPAVQPVGPTGGFTAELTVGGIEKAEQKQTLTMTQLGPNGAPVPSIAASLTFTTTELYVASLPKNFRPGQRLRLRAGGFYGGGRTLWGHVRGPVNRTVRIGRIKGRATGCGKVTARRRMSRAGDPVGRYIVQYDTRKRYSASSRPAVRRGWDIFTRIRRSSLPNVDFSQGRSTYRAG